MSNLLDNLFGSILNRLGYFKNVEVEVVEVPKALIRPNPRDFVVMADYYKALLEYEDTVGDQVLRAVQIRDWKNTQYLVNQLAGGL